MIWDEVCCVDDDNDVVGVGVGGGVLWFVEGDEKFDFVG